MDEALQNAKVTLFMDNHQLYPEQETAQDGSITFDIPYDGSYSGNVTMEEFIENDFFLQVECNNDPTCIVRRLVVMSPELAPEQTRIMMTWDEFPNDLDLHVMSVNMSDSTTCRTWPEKQKNCPQAAIQEDVDSHDGGLKGAETITLTNKDVNKDYVYVIGVDDYNFNDDGGENFIHSNALITVTNGLETEYNQMPPSLTKPDVQM